MLMLRCRFRRAAAADATPRRCRWLRHVALRSAARVARTFAVYALQTALLSLLRLHAFTLLTLARRYDTRLLPPAEDGYAFADYV